MESKIIVHWGDYERDPYEKYVVTHFKDIFRREWLQSDFAKFCIEDIDKCKYLGGILIDSPWLGPIPPSELSGGVQTLLVAYNNKDKAYPLRNLGDNCAEAIYRSAIESPTQWTWKGYTPTLRPDQLIQVAATGEIITGAEWHQYCIWNAPDPVTLVPGIKHAEDYGDDE